MRTSRVAIGYPHRLFTEALAVRLGSETDIEVVGTALTTVELARELGRSQVDVVVISLDLDAASPFELIATSMDRDPTNRFVAVTPSDDVGVAFAAFEAGAWSLVLERAGANELASAIRAAGTGELRVPLHLFTEVVRRLGEAIEARPGMTARFDALPKSQRDLLTLLATGYSIPSAATALSLPVERVRALVGDVVASLGLRTPLQAIALMIRARAQAPAEHGVHDQ